MSKIKPDCEKFVRDYLSNIRAYITKLLIEKYKISQIEIAKRMKITQGAVSQYYNTIRGSKINVLAQNKDILNILDEVANKIANNNFDDNFLNTKICEICKILISNQGCKNEKNLS
ncbi:MAG: hypothetical protein KQA40_00390 [Candidatus Aenigmarchaeota archaeon]|nr:hypothetical protein [Candidatus Aenigmarchaeota archaeon]